jgi:IclR family KDG regulon transcriptional repressor
VTSGSDDSRRATNSKAHGIRSRASNSGVLGTIINCGRVLDLYDLKHRDWGVTEVSTALGISKSSTHSLLASLTTVGLLRRTPEGHYRLGWRIVNLHYALISESDLLSAAKDPIEACAQQLGEAMLLCVPEGPNVVVTMLVGSTRVVQPFAAPVGTRLPAHCTAAGKVLLAAQPWEKVEALLARSPLAAVTPHTITEMNELRAELQRVRESGTAFNIEERIPELCAVSAGILDFMGITIAAVSILVPCYRFENQKKVLVEQVKTTARAISRNIGYIEGVQTSARPDGSRR